MEEHIKKYSQIAQTGHYEPPKIEESQGSDRQTDLLAKGIFTTFK